MEGCASLFVYGTLMRGRPAHGLVARWVRAAQPATTEGRLFLMPPGYPALIAAPGSTPVRGEVLELGPGFDWARLDEYEGCDPDDPQGSLYRRSLRAVHLRDGGASEAWCYWMPAEAEPSILGEGARRLDEGRWPPGG